MMQIRRLMAGIVAAALLWGGHARADCAAARSFIVPVSGSKIPPDPVLYAFTPAYMAAPGGRLETDDPDASVSIKVVTTNDTFLASRIAVKQKSGTFELIVSMKVGDSESVYTSGSYVIDPAWKPPAAKAVKTTMLGKEVSAWTCSHNLTWNLEPSVDAMAYRVVWAESEQDLEDGKTKSAVFPPSMDLFFMAKPSAVKPLVKLGHPNCLYDNFEWPSAYVYVELVALHPDGSETPSDGQSVEVPWSFGQMSYGAMTDAFYEQVHGGGDEAQKSTPAEPDAKEQPPGAKTGPVTAETKTEPLAAEDPAEPTVKEGPGCSVTGSGSPVGALVLLAVLGLMSLRSRRPSRTG